MTGRPPLPSRVAAARIVVLVVVLVALAWQTQRAVDRIQAGRLLGRVEARTRAAIAVGRASSTMFAEHLAWLEEARRRDPLEIGVPIAQGAQYLLLKRPNEAIAAYLEADALERRPEIALNLGRAYWMQGNREAARVAFRRAVALNPQLLREVPAGAMD